ncbi:MULTISPECIES: type VI secretion system contractile sheath small subunit [Pseudomonas]|uniref:Type VI secretion system contractile sheath small subunit n=1 Tax=Pseudomonas putida TaxID=303 RepID=A0AAW5HCL5_PSEPU|nr:MULTISPECIES: type VI secretion system contractile sheath small subunit [Pseudomonas]MBP2272309.1 type VI secretion system protein ImpB [Pseudomonas sp. BP6]MBP2288721.1 type VI secretion system protein ImpB [Pseudomonas sp. BP7]MCO1619846.1 type VI secretion system contractile sheath small subunit [Pseudomonas putida]HDS1698583.1 type VI secretion system contractile sheath small subunit [Pseudomonas putida]HDS1703831.1 type VI secretion system contractile sheath small subunit [Pseudomonas 
MTKSSGSVAPKERINIKYVPATGDEQAEVELPHKMMVLGDFGLDDSRSLEDRQVMRIDKHTFNSVLNDADVSLAMSVPSALGATPDAELAVNLQFKSIQDFGPDRIARQVPELNKLLQLREALVALKGPLGNVPTFRKQLQQLLNDAHARKQLAQELDLVLEAPKAD